MIKVDWLVACIAQRVVGIGRFPSALAKNLYNPPANRKQELIPEEMSQTQLAYQKQGNMDIVRAVNSF